MVLERQVVGRVVGEDGPLPVLQLAGEAIGVVVDPGHPVAVGGSTRPDADGVVAVHHGVDRLVRGVHLHPSLAQVAIPPLSATIVQALQNKNS